MNEPWPGANWQPCLTGCAAQELGSLLPFYRRFAQAVRAVDPSHLVLPEPFVLFNFGHETTSLPAVGAGHNGMSFHVYATSAADNLAVMQQAVAAAQRNGDGLLATEWGAVTDPTVIRQTADQFDSQLLPWLFWSYNSEMVLDSTSPPVGANVDAPVVSALARPYALLTDGVPGAFAYDASSRVLAYAFSTRRPDGVTDTANVSVISVPPGVYPHGYSVTVAGATVVSANANAIQLQNSPGATSVAVAVAPKP